MARILVIDDDPAVRESIERMLRGAGYTVQQVATGEEGIARTQAEPFDVVLSDMRMPGLSGVDVLTALRAAGSDAAFILMTGFGTIDLAVEAMKLGAVDFVQKPFFRDELVMRVRAAAERRQLARQVQLLQRQTPPAHPLDGLVGSSAAMARAKDDIRRAAGAQATVLITGETGTGKELAARAIHAGSARAARTFVAINCAALTDSLLESELFGHARGAFTGAAASRSGLIEHASGGTLFLDEIATMPPALQAKLLRVLEAGEVRRLGENEVRRVDVRFLAATNADLAAAVEAGTFRGDLYYRVNVFRVHMPPLRERDGDVPELVAHFLDRYGRAAGITGATPEALAALGAHAYPGNVRELEHIVQRALAVARPPWLDAPDLPDEVFAPRPAASPIPEVSVAAARERAEREMIVAALARCRGEITAAARELQISRTTLWRMMKKHAIEA